jgi:thiol-disulfide isomerase/thioredoxin
MLSSVVLILMINTCNIVCLSVNDVHERLSEESDENLKKPLENIPAIPDLPPSIKDPIIWKNGTRIIFFYSPLCPHSQSMRPFLYQLIEQLYYKNVSGVSIGQVDVSIRSDISRAFRIKVTPTLLLFQNGSRYEFVDELSTNNLVNFIIKVLNHSLIEVKSNGQLQSELCRHAVLFMLVHDDEIHNEWQAVYNKVSHERTLISRFLYTKDGNLLKEMVIFK